jgi:hypothetical protein
MLSSPNKANKRSHSESHHEGRWGEIAVFNCFIGAQDEEIFHSFDIGKSNRTDIRISSSSSEIGAHWLKGLCFRWRYLPVVVIQVEGILIIKPFILCEALLEYYQLMLIA